MVAGRHSLPACCRWHIVAWKEFHLGWGCYTKHGLLASREYKHRSRKRGLLTLRCPSSPKAGPSPPLAKSKPVRFDQRRWWWRNKAHDGQEATKRGRTADMTASGINREVPTPRSWRVKKSGESRSELQEESCCCRTVKKHEDQIWPNLVMDSERRNVGPKYKIHVSMMNGIKMIMLFLDVASCCWV